MNKRSGRTLTAIARSAAFLAVLLVGGASVARAQAVASGGAWDVAMGLGVLSTSAYPGSDERYVVPFPDVRASYRSGGLSLSMSVLGGASLSWMDRKHGLLGGLSVRPGHERYRDGYSILGISVDHDRRTREFLRGAPDVSAPVVASAMLGLPTPVGILGASIAWEPTTISSARADAVDHRNHGLEYSLLYMVGLPVGRRLSVTATGRLAFMDRDYAATWYRVETPTSSLPAFSPHAGFHDAQLSVQFDYALTDRIDLSVIHISTTLLGDARRSPFTRIASTHDVAVALLWHL